MLARSAGGGLELGVRVSPGAKRSRVVGVYGDRLKVQVRAPAERGRANQELRELLAETFRVRVMDVDIVSGATSRDKVVCIRGDRLEEALAGIASAGPVASTSEDDPAR